MKTPAHRICVAVGAWLAAQGCGDTKREDVPAVPAKSVRPAPTPEPAVPTGPARPLEVTWSKVAARHEGAIAGGGKIEASGFRGNYHITLRDLPRGVKWKVGGQSGVTSSPVLALIDIPLAEQLGGLTFDQLKSFDPKLAIELALPDGRTGSTPLPAIDVTYMVEQQLLAAETGPVKFGDEPEDPQPRDSLIWPRGPHDKRFFGRRGKLAELDWVLIVNELPDEKGRKVCSGYKDNAGKSMPDITLVLKETEAAIHDRRTGDIVEKKVFAPSSSCPMFTFVRADQRTVDSSQPYQAIASWARTRVKR